MRTTIDLPDDLFRQAKASAALRGIKLRELISECLHQSLGIAGPLEPTAPSGEPKRIYAQRLGGTSEDGLSVEQARKIFSEQDARIYIAARRRLAEKAEPSE